MTSRIPNKYCHGAKSVADFLGSKEWNLAHKYWWNYVTALRGPDIDNIGDPVALKALLTCVLRGESHIDIGETPFAWDISYALDDDDYFYILDDVDDVNEYCELYCLIDMLSDDRLEHFKHHMALGFEALAIYHKYLIEDDGTEDDEINRKCYTVLKNIYFDLERNCPNSVFKHVKEFLMLISDEVDDE